MDLQKYALSKEYVDTWIKAQANVGTFDIALGSQIGIEPSMIFHRIMELIKIGGDNVVVEDSRKWIMLSSETLGSEDNFPWIPTRTIRDYLQKLELLSLLNSRVEAHSSNTSKFYAIDYEKAFTFLTDAGELRQRPGRSRQRPGETRQRLETDTSINKVVKRLKIKDLNIKDSFEPVARPRDLMFDAVAEVCVLDPKLQGSRIAKCSNLLKKNGYTPEDVLQFFTWWKSNDFRWRQSKQPPLPEDITTLIARSKSRAKTPDEPTSLFPADYIPGETIKEYEERHHDTN